MSDRWEVKGWWRRSGVMRQAFDIGFLDEFARFLAEPDPKGLPPRAHGLRYAGDPNRRATRLPPILMAWMQQRCLEQDGEDPTARATLRRPPTRRQASSLHLLRPAGNRLTAYAG